MAARTLRASMGEASCGGDMAGRVLSVAGGAAGTLEGGSLGTPMVSLEPRPFA